MKPTKSRQQCLEFLNERINDYHRRIRNLHNSADDKTADKMMIRLEAKIEELLDIRGWLTYKL